MFGFLPKPIYYSISEGRCNELIVNRKDGSVCLVEKKSVYYSVIKQGAYLISRGATKLFRVKRDCCRSHL